MKDMSQSVSHVEHVADRKPHPERKQKVSERDEEAKQNGKKPSEPIHFSIEQFIPENGEVLVQGRLLFGNQDNPDRSPRLHLIATDTAFYFHQYHEMQRSALPSNENSATLSPHYVHNAVINYGHRQNLLPKIEVHISAN